MAGATKYIFPVRMDVEPEWEEEFNRWYNEEHVPLLTKVPGVLSGRRFEAIEGEPKYLALYELESPQVLESDAWAKARETRWTQRIRPHTRNRSMIAYKLIYPQD